MLLERTQANEGICSLKPAYKDLNGEEKSNEFFFG